MGQGFAGGGKNIETVHGGRGGGGFKFPGGARDVDVGAIEGDFARGEGVPIGVVRLLEGVETLLIGGFEFVEDG